MRKRTWKQVLAAMVACVTLAAPVVSDAAQSGRGRGRSLENSPGPKRGWQDQGRGRANTNQIYQDPASASGYDAGYDLGMVDGRGGQRYDPVRHRDYRDADRGYKKSYGSQDGYKNNFRAGFRQGYEEGYREGARSRQ